MTPSNLRSVFLTVLSLVVIIGFGLPVLAADVPAKEHQPKDNEKDPVAAAYAMPHGTALNDKQQAALKKLKDRTEKGLREALAKVDKGADSKEKTAAAHKVMELKKSIREEIKTILDIPAQDAAKQQAECAKEGSGAGTEERRHAAADAAATTTAAE